MVRYQRCGVDEKNPWSVPEFTRNGKEGELKELIERG